MTRHPLDVSSAALLERIGTEEAREPATPSTHLVGGIAKVGAKLDDFLRALLEDVAKLAGRPVENFLPLVGSRTVSFRKTTAGQLLRATRDAAGRLVMPPTLRVCVEDIRGPASTSVFGFVVELRNQAAHEGAVPATARDTLRRLRALLLNHRREAGWKA